MNWISNFELKIYKKVFSSLKTLKLQNKTIESGFRGKGLRNIVFINQNELKGTSLTLSCARPEPVLGFYKERNTFSRVRIGP
jgi:hypothetical protein